MALCLARLTSFSGERDADIGAVFEDARLVSGTIIFLALGSACSLSSLSSRHLRFPPGWDLLSAADVDEDAAWHIVFFITVGVAALDIECVVLGGCSVFKAVGFAREARVGFGGLRMSFSFILGCCNGAGVVDETRVLLCLDSSAASFSSPSSFVSSCFRFPAKPVFGLALVASCFGSGCANAGVRCSTFSFPPSCGPLSWSLLTGLVSPKSFRGL